MIALEKDAKINSGLAGARNLVAIKVYLFLFLRIDIEIEWLKQF